MAIGLLVIVPLTGCLASEGAFDGPAEAGAAPAPTTLTLEFGLTPIGYDPRVLPVGVAEEPNHQSLPFEVPTNATSMTASADWSCTSLCRIEVRLHDPSDAVADRATGAGETVLKVASPAAGTWAFEWISDEVASVGVEGTVTVTISFD